MNIKSTFNLDETQTGELVKKLINSLSMNGVAQEMARSSIEINLPDTQIGIDRIYSKNCFRDIFICNDEIEFIEELYLGDPIPEGGERDINKNFVEYRIYDDEGNLEDDGSREVGGYRIIRSVIIGANYERKKPYHIFAIKIIDCSDDAYQAGEIIEIKRRDLCRLCVHRKKWNDEEVRKKESLLRRS